MTTHEHYIMDTNIRDEFDIYFTLNEKLTLLNRELKRTKKKIIVNQFIQSHFINDASYGGDYFWVDNDYINEFNDKLCSYMLHHESVKITINNIIKEINSYRDKSEEKADYHNDHDAEANDDEEFLREVESTPDIDFIETYNCEYDGEYYINNDADERYNGGVGGVGGDEFDDEEEEYGGDDFNDEEDQENEDDDNEEDEENEDEEEDENENFVNDEFEDEEVEFDDHEEEDNNDEDDEDEGFDDNGEEVKKRVNIPNSVIGKTPVNNDDILPIFPVFLLNKIICFFSGGK